MADEERWNAAWNKLAVLLPLILTAAIYLSSAANRAVIDYDEGYYSQVALQMVERGDWVTPYANGVRFLEKPPLMYWATAASFKIFGVSEFALRLPTALGVIALVWIVTLMARRASGPRTAMIAGLCTACCVGTFLFTRESLHDIWLVLFVTLALCAFLDWYLDPRHSRGRASCSTGNSVFMEPERKPSMSRVTNLNPKVLKMRVNAAAMAGLKAR